MEDFTHQQNDSIPEGLEFNESYMNQAFEMYAAEKESRKRRFYIWFWSISAGFAAVIGFCVFFFYPSESKQSMTVSNSSTTSNNKTHIRQSTSKQNVSLHTTNKKQTKAINTTTSSMNGDQTVHSSSQDLKSNQKNKRFNPFSEQGDKLTKSKSASFGKQQTNRAGLKPMHSNFNTSIHGMYEIKKNAGLAATVLKNADPLLVDSTNVNQATSGIHDDLLTQDSSDSTSGKPFVRFQRHHYFINFGINTLFGISELKGNFNVRESVGFGYDYSFNQRYFMSLNTEFYSIAKINYYRLIGENSSSLASTYFTKTTLKYVTIAPKIGVNFGKRHSATFGLGMEYLLKNTGERFEIREYAENGTTKSTNNYYETFNRFNYSVSFGYGFRFSKHTSLYATYNLGLSDVTKNYGTATTFDRNSRLQLMLRIKLF